MATTRARKTAAEQATTPQTDSTPIPGEAPAEQPLPTPEEAGPAGESVLPPEETARAESTPQVPNAAPLEPPVVHAAPEPPVEPFYATPTEVIPDDENLAEVIIDDATKQPPADPDSVFQLITPYGNTFMCTIRLVEQTFLGPHQNPIHRLLQPAGGTVSESVAARIRDRLVAQAKAAAPTAAAAADTDK